jgi:hypothetical protein
VDRYRAAEVNRDLQPAEQFEKLAGFDAEPEKKRLFSPAR